MKKKQKRGTDRYGSWDNYDGIDTELSFSWLMICLMLLALGIFIIFPRVPIAGVIWCAIVLIHLYKQIRDYFKERKQVRMEVIEEEKPPYHIQLAMEQERKEAEAKAQEQAVQAAKALEQLEVQKNSGLISQKEYDSRRQELLSGK